MKAKKVSFTIYNKSNYQTITDVQCYVYTSQKVQSNFEIERINYFDIIDIHSRETREIINSKRISSKLSSTEKQIGQTIVPEDRLERIAIVFQTGKHKKWFKTSDNSFFRYNSIFAKHRKLIKSIKNVEKVTEE
jgi:hypothetical protein